jgi:hypothetical protein
MGLQLGGWAWGQQPLTIEKKLVTKQLTEPGTWTDSLDKQLKRQNMDMRFGTWNMRNFDSFEGIIQI